MSVVYSVILLFIEYKNKINKVIYIFSFSLFYVVKRIYLERK